MAGVKYLFILGDWRCDSIAGFKMDTNHSLNRAQK